MTQWRKRPFPGRIPKELSVRFRGGTTIQRAEPETTRARHAELTANRIPSMSIAHPHAYVTVQKCSRQRTGSILWTRNLIGVTGVQISRGEAACQRNRAS